MGVGEVSSVPPGVSGAGVRVIAPDGMKSKLLRFVDERLGVAAWSRETLDRPIVGGASWPRALGATLAMLFLVEIVTGIALAAIYAPSTQTAWASVHFLQNRIWWGSLVRGMHHHAADGMIVLMGLHIVHVLFTRGYRAPREFNWWLGVLLFGLVVATAHFGALLPWDQRAYWITRVESSIMGALPGGQTVQRLFQGGGDISALTITRLYALHVALLPLLCLLVISAHARLARRHGPTAPSSVPDDAKTTGLSEDDVEALRARGVRVETYWPDQALRNAVVMFVVVVAVWLAAKRMPAPLEAPADPASQYPARPEWYLLWLFKLRHALEGPYEFVATALVPGVLGGALMLVPLVDRSASKRFSARLPALGLGLFVLAALGGSTMIAMRSDARDRGLQRARQDVDRRSQRARLLAMNGIPPEGALDLVQNDPLTRPGELYEDQCAGCHAPPGTPHRDAHGRRTNARAPALEGFATREWIRAFLISPHGSDFMGRTANDRDEGIDDMPPQGRRLGDEGMRAVVEFVYSQSIEPGDAPAEPGLVAQGRDVYFERCTSCHTGPRNPEDTEPPEGDAPDLTAWGSRRWVRDQILHPEIPANYGQRNRMPAFEERLYAREVSHIVEHVRRLRRRPAPPIEAPPPPRPEPAPAAAPAE